MDYDSVMEGLGSGRIGALGSDVMWHEPFDPADPIFQHPRWGSLAHPPLPGYTERGSPLWGRGVW